MSDGNGFMKGVLIGGLVGGIAGILFAPKAGSELIDDILETYDSAQKNGHDFVEAIKQKGKGLARFYNGEEEEKTDYTTFLIGGAIGAVVAGLAALLLAPDSGKKLRKLLGKQYDEIVEKAEDFVNTAGETREYVMDGVNDWKNTLSDLIKKLSNAPKKGHSSKINDILDLAHLGLGLYQQLQKRR